MNHAEADAPSFDRLQRMALLVGVLALGLALVGLLPAFGGADQFFRSYLLAFAYWLSLAVGALGITLLHNVVGGRWGVVIRRVLAACMKTIPLMALLAIPVLLGIPNLYHWAHHDAAAHDAILAHKAPYLNVPFFVARTVVYFALWYLLSTLVNRQGANEPRERAMARWKAISAPSLILFAFTVTFAAIDWIMSLEPHWFSTIYGAIYMVGQALQTFAFCIAVTVALNRYRPFRGLLHPDHFHDLGNLMFAFTVLWAYVTFSQFIIIWSGNIPEETPWYIRRSNNGWQFVAVFLMLFHFFVPFFILLNRFIKRNPNYLGRVALAVIAVRLVDLFYWIEPAFEGSTFRIHWLDLVLPIGMGGLWLAAFLWALKRAPLLNVDDPRLPIHAHHGGGH